MLKIAKKIFVVSKMGGMQEKVWEQMVLNQLHINMDNSNYTTLDYYREHRNVAFIWNVYISDRNSKTN